jgi:hypothetical protein
MESWKFKYLYCEPIPEENPLFAGILVSPVVPIPLPEDYREEPYDSGDKEEGHP